MKRLWIAAGLLAVAILLCAVTTQYQHRQIDRMLSILERLEETYAAGDLDKARELAENLVKEYEKVSGVLYCFVAHSDLADSQETIALLPALLHQNGQEELKMEIARVRKQLQYLRGVDDPSLSNIL